MMTMTKCARLTLWRDRFIVLVAAEQSSSVEDLMQDDREAVDVALLGSRQQTDARRTPHFQQLWRRPQQSYTNHRNCPRRRIEVAPTALGLGLRLGLRLTLTSDLDLQSR